MKKSYFLLVSFIVLILQSHVFAADKHTGGPGSFTPGEKISADPHPGGIGKRLERRSKGPKIPKPRNIEDKGPTESHRHIARDFERGGIGYDQKVKSHGGHESRPANDHSIKDPKTKNTRIK